MMTKIFLLFIGLNLIPIVTQAQSSETKKEETPEKISDRLYKIDLDKPAECIQKMYYQKSGKDVDAELIDDGKTILIKNFHEGNAMVISLLLKDGEQKQFIKSPCSLQVVTPL